MSLSPFANSNLLKLPRGKQPIPQEVTLDDFSGGLDLTEADLKLTTNFSKVETNVHRDVDGTKSVRWGTRYRYNVNPTVTGDILDGVYFRDKLLFVTVSGQICTIDGSGTITAIWNTAIAAALPGAPTAWSGSLTLVDFTEFKNELVVTNGVDKPILVSKTHTVKYLQDIPTGSNVNVPIGKFVTTVGNYTVMAGITASPDEVYISSAGTSGTWPGDTAPNDSLSINIAAYTAQPGGDIRGLSSFRNFLVIHFATTSVVMVLGEYDSTVHKPRVLDTIPEHGAISHRTINILETDIIYADELGVHKARRNTFGNALDAEKISMRVQTDFIRDVMNDSANRLRSFSVHNKLENRIMFFLYNGTSYAIYVMSFDEKVKKLSWSKMAGWNFRAGVSTAKGRIYLTEGPRVYQYGNSVFAGEEYTGDFMDYAPDGAWTTATGYVVGDIVSDSGEFYRCIVAHTSSASFAADLDIDRWEVYNGTEIDFDWELPWTDANTRMRKKRISFIALDTLGTATFTMEVYTDNARFAPNGDDDPALSLEFVAGDSPGYGGGDQPYGGGRRAADERLWGYPVEFKILKMRLKGSSNKRLQIVAISILHVKGTYKR